jgi:NAD(P)-dependent dehydrogenase (short-subunit alcohol dehydrogenase family)
MNIASIEGKHALVIGGSSGVGKATVQHLISAGARVTAVARGQQRLQELAAEVGRGLETVQGDATDPAFVGRLLRKKPDLVVVAAGIVPPMGTVDAFEWESFSAAWNTDLKASFHIVKQALSLPLAAGSSVVLVSSGAAIQGSPLSGGYAGAKRMQWLMAGYAQKVSDARKLGIRIMAVLPTQLIEGTTIGMRAAATYGELAGISAEAFMKRYEVPLDVDKVAAAIASALCGSVPAGVHAIAVNGAGSEPLA